MKQSIERLDRWLRENRPDYYADLQPGVTETELSEFENLLGFGVPQSFKDLYMWRDGQAINSYKALQFNLSFMNIKQIKYYWAVLNDLLDTGEFDLTNWWHREWIPFLDNGGGDHLCIDMSGVFTGTKGQIIEFWHDSDDRSIQYPSLEKWLEVFVGSLDENLWEDVDGDFHPTSDARWESFLAKHNPGFPITKMAG
jgi:cell wall assembly regulator SMI1